jgi:peroxiredoxin
MGQALLWALTVVSLVGVAALSLALNQLLRQQGLLLIRQEQIESLAAGAQHAQAPQQPQVPSRPLGSAVEQFELPDLAGDLVTLGDFRGKKVVLVHWSPSCGFCEKIAADLAGLEGILRKRNAELVLMSYGDAERNRTLAQEHGLSAPILLQADGKTHPVFGTQGTPVGYLLDENGRIASALAVGANEVPELARSVAEGRKKLGSERSLEESHIERDGLKAGAQAPEFTLENVNGGEVALTDYRGRDLLLVFSDPQCGPCTALLPDLAKLQESRDILMISRGDAAENLAKAEEHGLDFPVVLQDGWKLSKEYGIFATPVAFLVDEEGVIARDVAHGRDQILALARAMPARKEVPLTH